VDAPGGGGSELRAGSPAAGRSCAGGNEAVVEVRVSAVQRGRPALRGRPVDDAPQLAPSWPVLTARSA